MRKFISLRVSDGRLTLFRLTITFLCSFFAWALIPINATDGDSFLYAAALETTGLSIRLAIFVGMVAIMVHPRSIPIKLIWRRDGISPFSYKQIANLAVLFLVLRLGVGAISVLYMQFFQPTKFVAAVAELEAKSFTSLFPSVGDFDIHAFAQIIFAPIVEEIIYRGFIMGYLFSKYRASVALLITSIFFAVFHGASYFSAFLGGLALGILYIKYGRLYVCILAHVVGNILAASIENLFFGEFVVYDLTHLNERPLGVLVSLISICVYIAFTLNWLRKDGHAHCISAFSIKKNC